MFVLLLMLDNPALLDRVTQAWVDLGIRGIYTLESAGCRQPEEPAPARGPTGYLSFASLFDPGRYCHALLLAAVDSLEAAARVTRIAGPWEARRTAMMFALPVAASWGTVFAPRPAPPPAGEPRGAPGTT